MKEVTLSEIVESRVEGAIEAYELMSKSDADLKWVLTAMVEEIFHELGRQCFHSEDKEK